jgi:hypothetical protein
MKLGEFNTRRQLMTVDIELSVLWWDSRLAYNASCATELVAPYALGSKFPGSWMPPLFEDPYISGIWAPRIRIDNLFPSGSDVGFYLRSHTLRFASAGLVWYTARASVDVKCSMDFSKMPWDVQSCPVRVMALEGIDRVNVSEAPDTRIQTEIFESMSVRKAMSSVEWECTALSRGAGSYHDHFGETYFEDRSFLELTIVLRRQEFYYRTHVIIPTILLLLISWASFFIARAAVPARVCMAIICYLTLTNLASSVNASIPKVSYPVALIDFIQASRWLVFYSIIEYALANWLMRIEKRIEAAAAKVAKQVEPQEVAKSSTWGELPSAVVEPGEVQIKEESARSDGSARSRQPSIPRMLTRAATFSISRKRDVPAIKEHLRGADRLLVNSAGRMIIRDQHLDVFSRYAYPIACAIAIAKFYSHIL